MKPAKLIAGTALLCAAAFPVSSRAQDYPSRSVLFVVPFTPGTAADSLARLVQPHLSQRWGVPVVVENRPGASGIIGIDSVAKANPDGYTCLFTSTAFGTLAAINPKLPYDPDKSFAPVMLVGTSPLSLLVSNNFPAKTVKELIARAKERPSLQRRQGPRHAGCLGPGKHGTHRGPDPGASPIHRPRHHRRAPASGESGE